MKKIVVILLCVLMLFSLCSCKKEYVHTDDALALQNANEIVDLQQLTPELALRLYYEYYPTDDTVIYLPQSGEFKTKKGEKFTAEVSQNWRVHFVEDTEISCIYFDINIYDENGELIVTKSRFQSYVQVGTKKLDLTYVSEEFKPYWEVIAVRSDKMVLD